MADGFPVPICHFKRANTSRLFENEAYYGYCAAKSEQYYGFKGNLSISSQGVITGITLTAANIDERESLYEVVTHLDGLLIADKGLIGAEYQHQFRTETGVNLQTPMRSNMKDPRGKHANKWITSTRRLVETVIAQLTEQFNIQKVRARNCWQLTNRITRKVLAHTVAIYMCKQLNIPGIQFEKIITS